MKLILLLAALALTASAQVDSWRLYHGDYSGRRQTPLTQITPDNVTNLQQVWRWQSGNQNIKASPILVDGILYITAPDNIWAIDARTAKEIWHYTHPQNGAFHIGHRGAAIYKDTVYLTTP
jgi:alcohol dehydrogenase (cytochrome c)